MKLADGAPVLAGLVLLAAGFYVWKKGGISQAAAAIGSGAVTAAGGAVSGAVGAVGSAVGLPTPDETTTDPRVARWLIDRAGYLEASRWSGLPALLSAVGMDAGTGTPPPAGSAIARAFPVAAPAPVVWPGLVPDGWSFDDARTADPYQAARP